MRKRQFAITSAVAVSVVMFAATANSAGHRLTRDTRVTSVGIGAVRVGMSKLEAERALGDRLLSVQDENEGCAYVKPESGPEGISFMLIDGRVARVDVENSFTRTTQGAGVGDSEARIKRLYRGRVRVTPHEYVQGHYLTVTGSDRQHRIVFETEGKKVTSYHAGRLPEVGYVEGCS